VKQQREPDGEDTSFQWKTIGDRQWTEDLETVDRNQFSLVNAHLLNTYGHHTRL